MSTPLASTGSVLMSGATGFLGRAVLAELLDTTDASVICLVRGAGGTEASERGHRALRLALDREPTPAETARVTWLRADLEEPRLGLDPTDWARLAAATGDVLHCAASVRFDLELPDAQRINVDGTAHLLEVASEAQRQGHFGCFHHVSTAYVAGRATGTNDADFLPTDRSANFRNTYELTKARAERLLRSQSDVPVSIYRPSMIGGSTETGHTDNWNAFYIPMRLLAKGQLPILPVGGDQLLDMVGVDYVARGIVSLAGRDRHGIVGHHLTTGSQPATVEQLAVTSREIALLFDHQPSDPRLVSPAVWAAITAAISGAARAPRWARRLRRWGRLSKRGLQGFAPYAPYTSVCSRFENHRERRLLAAADITMPDAVTYLETMATYAIGTDFGRTAIEAPPVQTTR